MAKGYLKEPVLTQVKCQWCDKHFEYIRETPSIRKACFECIPEGEGGNIPLLRRLIKQKALRYKGGKCEMCGLEDEPYMYDFHHKDPNEKDFSLGSKTSTTKWHLIEAELDKCMLLCANCHRKIHYYENIDE
ncbi:MAG: hypothetical protein MSA56_12565 [Clostridium sp.]|nr:hypothetical protein [Clostridium sp.]